MSDQKTKNEQEQASAIPKDYGDAARQSKTMRGIQNLVDALCEEPFESEAEDEDVSALRAELVRRARLYAARLEERRSLENQKPPPSPKM